MAQTPPELPKEPFADLAPDTVVAIVNGKDKVTAGELQKVMQRMPGARGAAPEELIRQYTLMKLLIAEAEQQKLQEQSPWKEDLEWNRNQVLATARINQAHSGISIKPEEQQKFYDTNKNRYEQAKVKLIYIPFNNNPAVPVDPKAKKPLTEAEAKTKAEDLRKQIQAGADFLKLVKENSEDATSVAADGDFGTPIRRTDTLPEAIKTAIFALKPGEVTAPLGQPNGYYLFRLEDLSVLPYEKVRDDIYKEIQNSRFQEWMAAKVKGIEIKMQDPAPKKDANSPKEDAPSAKKDAPGAK